MGWLVLALRLVLAVVFGTAGIAKLLDLEGSRQALADFRVPRRWLRAGAIVLPALELATAVALVPKGSARWGAVAAAVLLLAFIGGIARALARGEEPDCHCFGQIHSAPAGRATLARNAVLAVLAAVVVWRGPGHSIATSNHAGVEALAVVVTIAAILLAALALQLWLSNRSLAQELARAKAELALFPPGLPVGAPAPGFSLKGLHGETVTLESLRADSQHLLLVFVAPTCGPCWLLLPHLRRWQATLSDRLTVAILSTGTEEENRDVVEEHEIGGIFLHDAGDTMQAYRMDATPSAVLVSPDRRILSQTIVGARPLEPLIRMLLARGTEPAAAGSVGAAVQPSP
jgi:uncharacterized membrane protein YphA (DoxX/SURF4 family)/peroxiredoxin